MPHPDPPNPLPEVHSDPLPEVDLDPLPEVRAKRATKGAHPHPEQQPLPEVRAKRATKGANPSTDGARGSRRSRSDRLETNSLEARSHEPPTDGTRGSRRSRSDRLETDHHEASTEQDWQTLLRSQGYRLTPQRELVLAAVETLGHATPDEVFAEVRRHSDSINLSTVYRTLELLDELGLIRHAHLSDRAPTYHSARGHEHAHLVCRSCHRSFSVGRDEAEAALGSVVAARSFTPDYGHLTVFGVCAACATD